MNDKYGKIVSFIHTLIKLSYMGQDNLNLVDATCGNGFDTLFLCNVAGKTGHVIGFDIQKEAIERTNDLLKRSLDYVNYKIINDSHEFINKYISSLDVCIFNLGYLPQSDKKIRTDGDTTVAAINSMLSLLNTNGRIYITAYITHDTGEEYTKISEFLTDLNNSEYNVLHISLINKANSPPEIFIVEKNA
ncbi:class I SAM-dependent methyltransferase [Sedimentibacter sp.]|uniref:class I SAM-dependent methyltransferase n=1 Tax=Sedimentibacter sp. TaxID=1960295 RepID=UPI0028ACBA3E|nr:class I SAM-dependent methyltransferase [Sedimentibacter sp.]